MARPGIVLGSDPSLPPLQLPQPPPQPPPGAFVSVPEEDRNVEVWGRGQQEDTEAPTVWPPRASKAKMLLLDFTASQQNAVQHLGQKQPAVCGDERLPDHLHGQPGPADARLQAGLWALGCPASPSTSHATGVSQGSPRLRAPRVCKTSSRLPTWPAPSGGHRQGDSWDELALILQQMTFWFLLEANA